MSGNWRYVGFGIVVLLAGFLPAGSGDVRAGPSSGGLTIPDYTRRQLEQETTTHRPGTDLQFYALELKIYVNPKDQAEMVVELRRHDVLYIIYHYTIRNRQSSWAIYMDAGFANAPCGFFDPQGIPTGRYIRIDLRCLRETERVDKRSDR